jgi:hypothetical protein
MMTVGPKLSRSRQEHQLKRLRKRPLMRPRPNRSPNRNPNPNPNPNPKRLLKRYRLTATMKKRKRQSKVWRLPRKDIKPACAGFFMRGIALSFAQSNQNLSEPYGP